jgi:hypothetical protein
VTGRTCFLRPFWSLIGAFIGAFPINFEVSIFSEGELGWDEKQRKRGTLAK